MAKYPSLYSPKEVTAAQFIIELICQRKAQADGKSLSMKFWNHPDWSKFYRSQLRKCHTLIKKYGEGAVIAAIRDEKKTKYCRTLFSAYFESIVEEKQKELSKKPKTEVQTFDRPTRFEKPKNRSKKGILSKLDDIDKE